ncbi:ribosome silencing factor [Alloprevotella sp. OH1205_COT-284]|uniref:ribosome silencing factor n=1 Tax=Alloprevotella sp. OH1205_COT-284 TaxID=2491043 RepID=UPI0026A71B1A
MHLNGALILMTKDLIDIIIDGIQEKKGRDIVVADLSNIHTAPTQAFVICTAGSPSQADSIVDSIENAARTRLGESPSAIAGRDNKLWIAMDFGNVMVHIFLPDMREYYDIEHLWDDAAITAIPDLD